MKKLGDKITRIIGFSVCVLTGLIAMWFLFANANTIAEHALLRFAVYVAFAGSFIGALLVAMRQSIVLSVGWVKRLLKNKYTPTAIIIFSLAIGLCLRVLIPIKYSDYQPLSDPKTYHEMATMDHFSDYRIKYIQEFPYVLLYSDILKVVDRVFHNVYLSSIILNTTVGLLSSLIIYIVVRRFASKTQRSVLLASIGFAAWFLNPFEILFTALTLPIVLTNFAVLVILLLGMLLVTLLRQRRIVLIALFALAFGAIAGAGNYLRPIMTVLIIAIIASIIYMLIKREVTVLNVVLAVLLIALSFTLSGWVMRQYVHYRINLEPTSNTGGWSFYVGSNMETGGRWNQGDKDFEKQICANLSQDDCQKELYRQGFERYKSYGVMGSLMLYIDKMRVFAGYQPYVYNVESIVGFKDSKFYRLMQMAIILYIFALFTAVIALVVSRLRSRQFIFNGAMMFVMLALIGVFVSAGIMEVSQRYAQPIYPIVVVAVIGLFADAVSVKCRMNVAGSIKTSRSLL